MAILWWGLKTALELYSITGNCVLRQGAEGSASSRQIDLSQLPAGIYFLVVQTDSGANVQRVVVH